MTDRDDFRPSGSEGLGRATDMQRERAVGAKTELTEADYVEIRKEFNAETYANLRVRLRELAPMEEELRRRLRSRTRYEELVYYLGEVVRLHEERAPNGQRPLPGWYSEEAFRLRVRLQQAEDELTKLRAAETLTRLDLERREQEQRERAERAQVERDAVLEEKMRQQARAERAEAQLQRLSDDAVRSRDNLSGRAAQLQERAERAERREQEQRERAARAETQLEDVRQNTRHLVSDLRAVRDARDAFYDELQRLKSESGPGVACDRYISRTATCDRARSSCDVTELVPAFQGPT